MGKPSLEHVNESMNEFVSQPVPILDVANVAGILSVNNTTFYTELDTFSGNIDSILGSVMQIKSYDPQNSKESSLEFCPTKIPNTIVDQNSHLKEPVKRQSIVVDQKISAEVNFLNYLSAQMDSASTFSLLVFDQATGLVDRSPASWAEGITSWKNANQDLMQDDSVTNLFVIIGYVQKYVIRKKYTKFDVKAKGGGFGINVNGELYTSSEDYSLDIRYGLTISSLKNSGGTKKMGVAPSATEMAISPKEMALLNSFDKVSNSYEA